MLFAEMINRLIKIHNNGWDKLISATNLSQRTLSSYRRIFVLVSLIFFVPDSLWIGELPDALFNPPRLSIWVLFSGFPSIKILYVLHYAIIVSLILIGLNFFKNISGIIYFILVILLSGFGYSLGKIDHGILLPTVILCFSLSNWNSTSKEKMSIKLLPIPGESLLALFIAFGMFTAGFQKSLNWIDFNTNYSGFLNWFYPGYFNLGKKYLLAPLVFDLHPYFIELLDYLAVIFELSPFFLLLSGKRKLWKFWLLVACLFHIMNLAFLNISFLTLTLVYLPFLLPTFLINIFSRINNKLYNVLIILVGFIQILSLFFNNHTIIYSIVSSLQTTLHYSLIFWIIILILGIISYLEPSK